MTIFGDSNFQTINNNNHNHNNNSMTNQVVCEAPPAGRPWFGDEKLENLTGRALIAVLILIAIYLAVAIIKRLCKARRRCLRHAAGKTHKKHKKSHKRHHRSRRSEYLSTDDTDSQPDSPRPAESLADSDVQDYESVSHASGECAPAKDSDAAAVPSLQAFASQQEAVRVFNARNSETPALVADKTTTESSRCVRCCYRVPIVARWILAAVFVYVVISLVIFPFPLREPTVDFASWIIRYVLPERVSIYQIYSFISNVWYWADWLQVHYLKVLGVLTSLTGIVVWLFNAAPKKAN